jgi:RHS repeat-associated protein
LGRVTQKKYTNLGVLYETIDYVYDNYTSSNKGRGKLYQVKKDNLLEETIVYDDKSRISTQTKVIDGTSYPYSFTYNTNGQLQQLTYPENFAVNYSYSPTTGKLEKIERSDNSLIYQINSRDPIFKSPTLCSYGNRVTTNYSYNQYGLVTQINTGTILNYNYTYNTRGVMDSRSETTINRKEIYEYDNLDRLTGICASDLAGRCQLQTFSYNANGNFSSNSKLGEYFYETAKLHAVTTIEQYHNIISPNQNDVTYNFFNQPTNISEGDYELELFYGSNQRRNKAVRYHNNNLENTRYYINKYYEKEIDSLGATRHYHYIYAGGGIVALHIATPNTDSMYFVHTDHLGSYCAITNQNKTVRQRNFFEPWGNNIGEINYSLVPRGFTGHEHYPKFQIINMNGRLYDPVIARFFSPDKYVANSSFTQDLNRYTYARGCPLMYTDPDGEFIYLNLSIGWSQEGGFSISLGVGVGFKNYLSAGISVGYSFGNNSWSFSGDVGYGGGYVSGGWNSNAGWNVSTGYSYGVQVGPFSVSVFNASLSYSQNGGFSANFFYANYNQYGGFSWNPSWGIGYTVTSGAKETYLIYEDSELPNDPVPYSTKYALEFMKNNDLEMNEMTSLSTLGRSAPRGTERRGSGLYDIETKEKIAGIAVWREKKYYFWGPNAIDIYLARCAFDSPEKLYLTIGHELIHADLMSKGIFDKNLHDRTAYKFNLDQLNTWGLSNSKAHASYTELYGRFTGNPSEYFIPIRPTRPKK